MIGPPGLPKIGRRVFSFTAAPRRARARLNPLKWATGLYLAGVLAHFSHHMAFDLPRGANPSLDQALIGAPIALAWPADLIHTLIRLS
ncbi:MAG TPA: hypothetical protein VKQ73_13195 [Stellaceae bacterium]|nr:hypothetical protein [Stellaceae bacterium]